MSTILKISIFLKKILASDQFLHFKELYIEYWDPSAHVEQKLVYGLPKSNFFM
jgi:hypothetical protein